MIKKRLSIRRRLSITPLIDVIFLLLLFFMLDTTFVRFSEIEVSVSNSHGTQTLKKQTVMHLTIAEHDLILDGNTINEADLISQLESASSQQRALAVNPDNSVSTQRMIDVLALLKKASSSINIKVVAPQ